MKLSTEQLEKLIKQEPRNVLALCDLSDRHFKLGNNGRSIWLLHSALDIMPESLKILLKMATRFYRTEQYNEACRYYELALEAGSEKSGTLGALGAIKWRIGETTEARRHLETAYENGNRQPQTLFCLAAISHLDANYDKALALMQEAVQKKPKNSYYGYALETLSVRHENIKNPPKEYQERRIALHINQNFHYNIMKPIFDELSKAYHVVMTDNPYWLREFDPDIIIVADSQARTLKQVMPRSKYVFTCHGFSSKNHVFKAASHCDYICLSSPYQQKRYEEEGGFRPEQLWNVGYAQMDMLFHKQPTPLSEPIDPSQKTILYAPTYNKELSSAPMLGADLVNKIRGPKGQENLIIKPHPQIYLRSPEWMKWFREAASHHENVFFIEDPAANVMPYLKNADILVSDASSVIFEYLAMDRPIILLTNPEREKSTHYDPNGLEWRWRDVGEELSDVSALTDAVQKALASPDERQEQRGIRAEMLFGNLRNGETGKHIKGEIEALYDGNIF